MTHFIDITRPLTENLISWPGRLPPEHHWDKRIAQGDHCNASFWKMSAHSGTHMDAPLHFIEGGRAIDQIPPDVFIGVCTVIDSPSRRPMRAFPIGDSWEIFPARESPSLLPTM